MPIRRGVGENLNNMESQENNITPNVEVKESFERGRNVLVSIDLIRHPEKDPKTGKLTEKGKEKFFEELKNYVMGGNEYDTVKFYVSPLSRGQESKEPISRFLEVSGIDTKIRNKKELAGRATEIGPDFKKEMTAVLEKGELLTAQQIEEARQKDAEIPAYEPSGKDFETKTNEILIRDYFDKNFPGSSFTGKEMGEPIKDLVDHFSELATRLKSGSKVKLVSVGHSGVIEHFTKYVYLQNHPELKPNDVDVGAVGGIIDFGQGPEITIVTDDKGEQKITFRFKDLELAYPVHS